VAVAAVRRIGQQLNSDGTYTIPITVVSTGMQHSVNLTLTVE